MIGQHFTENFPTSVAARSAARRLRGSLRLSTATVRCSICDAYHILANDNRIDKTDRLILTKVAMGLRAHEIALDLGQTQSQVTWRIRDLQVAFDALSRSHLIALAIFFGLIDVSAIALCDTRKRVLHG